MNVDEINRRVYKAGTEHFKPDHFGLVCMSLKSRMSWALSHGVITQKEHDAVKESAKADDYFRWEYAE